MFSGRKGALYVRFVFVPGMVFSCVVVVVIMLLKMLMSVVIVVILVLFQELV